MTIAKAFKSSVNSLLTTPSQIYEIEANENDIWENVILLASNAHLVLPPHTDNSISACILVILRQQLRTSRYWYIPSHKDS